MRNRVDPSPPGGAVGMEREYSIPKQDKTTYTPTQSQYRKQTTVLLKNVEISGRISTTINVVFKYCIHLVLVLRQCHGRGGVSPDFLT